MKNRDMAILAALSAGSRERRVYERSEVTVNRAPTDESVRLLAEMEQKARERVIASMPLTNNCVAGRVIVESNAYDWERVITARVKINGVPVEATVRENLNESTHNASTLLNLRDVLAKEIANKILEGWASRWAKGR